MQGGILEGGLYRKMNMHCARIQLFFSEIVPATDVRRTKCLSV